MSNNIVFSSSGADKLNSQVEQSVASHLFLLCNYNPDSIKLYSDDARFVQAAFNMYKFLVDASICNNLHGLGKKYSITYDYKRLDYITNIIKAIRTMLAHNVDERNGTDEYNEVVEKWLLSVTGKKQLDNEEEYEKVVDTIEKYGEECVNILSTFIESASKNSRKAKIVEEWEQLIINFYKRSNSKNIFEGQLLMAYQSRVGNVRRVSKVDVACWVQKMLNYSEKSQIETLQELMRKSSFSVSILKNIGEKIEQSQTIIKERIDHIALSVKKSADSLGIYDYWDYYLNLMPNKVEKKLIDRDLKSLLPQDVVQQIIEEDFNGVPI